MRIYYSIGKEGKIFRSVDGVGYEWEPMVPNGFIYDAKITVPKDNPYRSAVISSTPFVDGVMRFFYSDNAGYSYQLSTGDYTSLPAPTLGPEIPGYVSYNRNETYAIFAKTNLIIDAIIGYEDQNVYLRSIDGGESFNITPSILSLPPGATFSDNRQRDLYFNPNNINIGVAKIGQYVYVTPNGGAAWISIAGAQEFPGINVTRGLYVKEDFSIAIFTSNTRLYIVENLLTVTAVELPRIVFPDGFQQGLTQLRTSKDGNWIHVRNGEHLIKIGSNYTVAQIVAAVNSPITSSLTLSPSDRQRKNFVFINENNGCLYNTSTTNDIQVTENGGIGYIPTSSNTQDNGSLDIDGAEIECGCPEGTVYDETLDKCTETIPGNDFITVYPAIPCPGYIFRACPDLIPEQGQESILYSFDDGYLPYVGQTVHLGSNNPKYLSCYQVTQGLIPPFVIGLIDIINEPVEFQFNNCEDCLRGIIRLTDCQNSNNILYTNTPEFYQYLDSTISFTYNNVVTCYSVDLVDISLVTPEMLTDLIDTVITRYVDCECCLDYLFPEPEEPKKLYRFYDKAYINTVNNNYGKCDIQSRIKFGNAYYALFLEEKHGIKYCCPGELIISKNKFLLNIFDQYYLDFEQSTLTTYVEPTYMGNNYVD